MKVLVELKETSQPIIHENVKNVYLKGIILCVYDGVADLVYKYPLDNVWRWIEPYHKVKQK